MTLPDICEPLFQYVCRLNRSARKRVALDSTQVRNDVKSIFSQMKASASASPLIREQYDLVEPALLVFLNGMIEKSRLPFASSWKRLGGDHGEDPGGQDAFFSILERTLAETGEAANQRLIVLYTCMGLGFTGPLAARPDELRRKMMTVGGRIRSAMDADHAARICPEAYDKVDTRMIYEPPSRSLTALAIALIVMTAALIAANVVSYRHAQRQLDRSLTEIIKTQ